MLIWDERLSDHQDLYSPYLLYLRIVYDTECEIGEIRVRKVLIRIRLPGVFDCTEVNVQVGEWRFIECPLSVVILLTSLIYPEDGMSTSDEHKQFTHSYQGVNPFKSICTTKNVLLKDCEHLDLIYGILVFNKFQSLFMKYSVTPKTSLFSFLFSYTLFLHSPSLIFHCITLDKWILNVLPILCYKTKCKSELTDPVYNDGISFMN